MKEVNEIIGAALSKLDKKKKGKTGRVEDENLYFLIYQAMTHPPERISRRIFLTRAENVLIVGTILGAIVQLFTVRKSKNSE